MKIILKIFVFTSLLLIGCAANTRIPNFAELYNRSAQYKETPRNPIILIPGILGSRLIKSETGRVVWGSFSGGYANPKNPEDARLIALPMQEGTSLNQLTDSVVSNGTLDRIKVKLFGLPIEMSVYIDILAALGIGGYRDEQLGKEGVVDYGDDHFTCFQFDYDWRRDNVENTIRFHEFLLEKRAYVQTELENRYGIKNYDVKFDVITHSMGGLLARYYLRYGAVDLPTDGSLPPITWAGGRYVERVVLIGPPNAGTAKALFDLIRGRKFGFLLPKYEPALLGTMPAIYQLLPRGRHGALVDAVTGEKVDDILDPILWEKMAWGLAAPDQDHVLQILLPQITDAAQRRRIALDHQKKCLSRAKQFTKALDIPASPPGGLDIYLIAGDALPTPAVVAINQNKGKLTVQEKKLGDGIVLRSSALMDERLGGTWSPTLISPITWRQVLFLFTEHLAMTKDPAFTDNLLFLLLEQPRNRLKKGK